MVTRVRRLGRHPASRRGGRGRAGRVRRCVVARRALGPSLFGDAGRDQPTRGDRRSDQGRDERGIRRLRSRCLDLCERTAFGARRPRVGHRSRPASQRSVSPRRRSARQPATRCTVASPPPVTSPSPPLRCSHPCHWHGPAGARGRASVLSGIVSAACLVATVAGPSHGLFQRLGLGAVDIWIVATAIEIIVTGRALTFSSSSVS